MPTEDSTFEILAGSVVTTASTLTLVDAVSSGNAGALRTLTHPLGTTFPIVTYNRNPTRTINFDQIPLFPPAAELVRTLGSTLGFVTQNAIDDVVVTEVWDGSSKASMEASFFRKLYELSVNPPAPNTPENFILWAPADRTTKVYKVLIVGLRVGGQAGKLDVFEWKSEALQGLDSVTTGILDRTVELDLLLISEFP